MLGTRLLPGWLLHRVIRLAMGLPRHGALANAPPVQEANEMSLFDALRFDGKRVLVVGGATGMGAAAAELALAPGADVVVMDYAPVKLAGVKAIKLNLAEKASIEAAVDECGGPIHALLACAPSPTARASSGSTTSATAT